MNMQVKIYGGKYWRNVSCHNCHLSGRVNCYVTSPSLGAAMTVNTLRGTQHHTVQFCFRGAVRVVELTPCLWPRPSPHTRLTTEEVILNLLT